MPTYRELWRFVFPLSGTAVMNTLVQPVVTAGIAAAAIAWASSEGSVVAVASYATAWSLAFLVFGPTLSITQASITWTSSPDPVVRQRGPRVIVRDRIGLALLMALVTFTPVAYWLFSTVLDAQPETAKVAVAVAQWLSLMPVLNCVSLMLRGKLIARRAPTVVRRAQLIDLVAIIVIIQLATNRPSPRCSTVCLPPHSR